MTYYTNITPADKWMSDALSTISNVPFSVSLEVDLTNGKTLLAKLNQQGIKITYTHLFVATLSRVLAKNPDLHFLVTNNKKCTLDSVDIGLSVYSDSFLNPVLVLRSTENKSIFDIAKTIADDTPRVQQEHKKTLASMNRWGWLVPFSCLRKLILRAFIHRILYRIKNSGTFQISCLPNVDHFAPLVFSTSAILGVGGVRDRAFINNGQLQMTPTVILTCCADHRAWNGAMASRFLSELNNLLTSPDLEAELLKQPANSCESDIRVC